MGWPKGKKRGPLSGVRLAQHAERMRKLHADPEFAARNAERMRKLHADPEFAARHAEAARERMRKLHADPEFAARLKASRVAVGARRCELCQAKHSPKYPVIAIKDEDGELFYACRDIDHCDAKFVGEAS